MNTTIDPTRRRVTLKEAAALAGTAKLTLLARSSHPAGHRWPDTTNTLSEWLALARAKAANADHTVPRTKLALLTYLVEDCREPEWWVDEKPRRRGRPTTNTERLNCLVDRQALEHLRALAKLAGHGQYVGAYLSARFRPAAAQPAAQK